MMKINDNEKIMMMRALMDAELELKADSDPTKAEENRALRTKLSNDWAV